jgi:hypothetical protein
MFARRRRAVREWLPEPESPGDKKPDTCPDARNNLKSGFVCATPVYLPTKQARFILKSTKKAFICSFPK